MIKRKRRPYERRKTVGQKFGRWTVLEYLGDGNCLCRCECGKVKTVNKANLTQGKTTSCGCYRAELGKAQLITHGLSHSVLYYVWCSMKNRCYNKRVSGYERYGGRGIKVCEEWKHDYVPFYEWAMANGYKKGLQIDRINNDGDYGPDNCRWITHTENLNNTSKTVYLTINGEKISAAEASKRYGISQTVITSRKRKGWADEEIVSLPSKIGNNQNLRGRKI